MIRNDLIFVTIQNEKIWFLNPINKHQDLDQDLDQDQKIPEHPISEFELWDDCMIFRYTGIWEYDQNLINVDYKFRIKFLDHVEFEKFCNILKTK